METYDEPLIKTGNLGRDCILAVIGGVRAYANFTMDGTRPCGSQVTSMLLLEGEELHFIVLAADDADATAFNRIGTMILRKKDLRINDEWRDFVVRDTEMDVRTKWEPYIQVVDII